MAFAKRRIEVTISLASGVFNESRTNTITLPPLRTSCRINKAGGLSDSTMDLQILGMTKSLMNQLSTLGVQINLVPKNAIVVTAGNEGESLGTVFVGYIVQAYAAFDGAPDVPFHVSAHTGLPWAVIPAPVSSFRGAASVATIMSGFATQMGLKFENNGVNAQLANPYYYGSVMSQARACVKEAGIEWNGGDNGILAIWPKNGSRGGTIPLISPSTGMIGYPTYNPYGLILKTLFNPSVGFGNKIRVESDLDRASGVWSVYSLDHDLQALVPDGKWESTIGAYNPAFPTPAVAPASGARP